MSLAYLSVLISFILNETNYAKVISYINSLERTRELLELFLFFSERIANEGRENQKERAFETIKSLKKLIAKILTF
jgi:hypothetical protein